MVSVAGVPSKIPSSSATIQEIAKRTEISILTCRHAQNVALAGELQNCGTIIITFLRSIAMTGHVDPNIVFNLDLAEANIQKVSIHTHFRTPVVPEKGKRDKEEKEKLK